MTALPAVQKTHNVGHWLLVLGSRKDSVINKTAKPACRSIAAQSTSLYLPDHTLLPSLLRRVIAHIHACLNEAPSIDSLVAVSAASRRSLEKAFRDNLQTSPMHYLRQCRLQAARQTLITTRPGEVKLAELPARLGFKQPSQFNHAYKEPFNELLPVLIAQNTPQASD